MTAPQRIQLSRAKGWRMPENTVKVDRSTRWGNPFKPSMVCVAGPARNGIEPGQPMGIAGAVEAFRTLMQTNLRREPAKTRELLAPLRGKNLACWCPLEGPCHADVLLLLANEP